MTLLTRPRRLHRAATAILAVCVLLSGAVLGITTSMGSAASAATRHGLSGPINGSAAVENSVRVSFNCDDSSGQWSFKISGVQVIKADHASPWSSFGVTFTYGKASTTQSHTVSLTQDLRNGLFDGAATGSDGPGNAFCTTAGSFKVGDVDTGGANLYVIALVR